MTSGSSASSLLSQLTLEEKAALCLGRDIWHAGGVERLGIPTIVMSDGPHGLRRQPDGGDIVGIGGSVPATCFPTASALGSSWDPELARRIGAAVADEALVQDVDVVLGPGINIKRSPLCGRNFEYVSEDPLLSGVIGAAIVDGIQGQGVGACVKHFAVNNQETDRVRVSADVDERALREIYLPAFERVITQARPWTVMCSYNLVNGVPASQHHVLLTEILRDEWGFDGLVMSDWGAVADRVAAVAAGLDLEMPPNSGISDVAIVDAVRSGALDESLLDASVARVLALVDRAPKAGPAQADSFNADAHHLLAREAAAECAVLLKNDDATLPLQPSPGDTIAVIGEFARTPRYQGAGSSQVNAIRIDEPLAEFRSAVPEGVDVVFAPGFGIGETERDDLLASEAVDVARRAGTVVLFLGLPAIDESEGYDRVHLELPANQVALVPRLAEVNPRLVVVLANGSAVQVAGWGSHAKAILECWLSGQAAGGAIADLLLGRVAPSGRLAETLPLRLQDTPSYLNFPGELGHVRYGEGVFVGYRGFDAVDRDVSYPFGHGLSYTMFEYANPRTSVSGSAETDDLRVTVQAEVTNTGSMRGREVVQLYVENPRSAVARPIRELRGFSKVDLAPGQSTTVAFSLGARDFSYWSVQRHGWVIDPGRYGLAIGASSRDIRLTDQVDVEIPSASAQLDGNSSLEEWMSDPEGAAALRKAIDESGASAEALADEELIRVIGNFPIARLTVFPGFGITKEILDKLGL